MAYVSVSMAGIFALLVPFSLLQGLFPKVIVFWSTRLIIPALVAAVVLAFASPNKSPLEKTLRFTSLWIILLGLMIMVCCML